MKPTQMEIDLLAKFFAFRKCGSTEPPASLDEVEVSDRWLSGAGFITDLQRHDSLRVDESGQSYHWGGIDGTLNGSVRVAFEFYVDDGYLTSIEGSTCGIESWPEKVTSYELHPEGRVDGQPLL